MKILEDCRLRTALQAARITAVAEVWRFHNSTDMLERYVYLARLRPISRSALLNVRSSIKRPLCSASHFNTSCGTTHHEEKQPTVGDKQSVPVAIVGAGPAGLTLSALLSQFGVPSVLLERAMTLPTHPQAHFVNLRTMEVLRHAFGGLDRAVLERCPPREEWRDFVVCSSVLGRQLARVDNFSGGEADRRAMSPTSVAHLSQSVLLPLLLQEARRAAVDWCPSSQVIFDTEATGVCQARSTDSLGNAPSHLELLVRRGGAAGDAATAISCDYVVAADGAGSSVREAAGFGMSGRRELGRLVNIHFRSKGLGRLLRAKERRPGMLYFVYNEETICVLVAHNVQKGEWACQMPFFPPHQTTEAFTPERSVALIRHALGPGCGSVDINVCSVRPWTMNALVADKYYHANTSEDRCTAGKTGREGGVFLLGDAAHQFPPAGGFGLNTGVQDAHNLAWKLAAVHHGLASRDLLLSYEQERRPVATRNATLSVRNLKRSLRTMESLGVNPSLVASSNVMDKLIWSPFTLNWSGGVSGLASSLWQYARGSSQSPSENTENILRLGRLQLKSLRTEGHPYGDARVRSLRRLLAEGGGLPLLFPEHDIGFVYRDGALVSGRQAEAATTEDREPISDGRDAVASGGFEACGAASSSSSSRYSGIRLGGRMPHFVLRPLDDGIARARLGEGAEGSGVTTSSGLLSTVDLPDQIRGVMLRSSVFGSPASSCPTPKGVGSTQTVFSPSDRFDASRGGLVSVLLVVASSDECACDNSGRDSVDAGAAGAVDTASVRWRRAAISAQRNTPTACPLVVMTVMPPRAKIGNSRSGSTSDSCMMGEKGSEEGVGFDYVRRASTLVGDPDEPYILEAITSWEDLAPYMSGETSAADVDTSKAACNATLSLGRSSEWPEGIVMPMLAVDGSAGNIAKAFADADADAVLLRPDGHVAWVSRRNGTPDGKSVQRDSREGLRRALESVFCCSPN